MQVFAVFLQPEVTSAVLSSLQVQLCSLLHSQNADRPADNLKLLLRVTWIIEQGETSVENYSLMQDYMNAHGTNSV